MVLPDGWMEFEVSPLLTGQMMDGMRACVSLLLTLRPMLPAAAVAALGLLLFFPEIHAEADCLRNFRFEYYQTLVGYKGLHRMSAWSGGGGRPDTLSFRMESLFAGRLYGGGDRWTIYGTRAFESGYPYGVNDTSTVAGRPFPYGPWPIYWSGNYAGSAEYSGKVADIQRPGGRLVNVELISTDNRWNNTDEEKYYLIGDLDSVVSITASTVDWCHTVPKWPSAFSPSTNGSLRPENVLQYYRSSSFALAFKGYNNSFALPPLNTSTNLFHEQSSPPPDIVRYSAFLKCINETIATALPILDGWAPKEAGFTLQDKIAVIIGCLMLVGFTWMFVYVKCCD